MRAQFLQIQHQKCLDILEMIYKLDNRIYRNRTELAAIKKHPANQIWRKFPFFNEDEFTKGFERDEAIKNRLCQSYINVMNKINDFKNAL